MRRPGVPWWPRSPFCWWRLQRRWVERRAHAAHQDRPVTHDSTGDCGDFRIAYDPSQRLRGQRLHRRDARRGPARVRRDLRQDDVAQGLAGGRPRRRPTSTSTPTAAPTSREKLTAEGGPVVRLGPTGFRGGVDLLAPAFMGDLGLETYRDLPDTGSIGWGGVTPAITTCRRCSTWPARSSTSRTSTTRSATTARWASASAWATCSSSPARTTSAAAQPLPGRRARGSSSATAPAASRSRSRARRRRTARSGRRTTLCSLDNFRYQKIVNSDFAKSGSPAYNLVYNYELDREEVDNLLEIVELSGYDVGPADVASWINTHENVVEALARLSEPVLPERSAAAVRGDGTATRRCSRHPVRPAARRR